jgi:hypothetical protein
MRAKKNELGFFEFSIKIQGPKMSRVLKGVVDTGSTFCACTYKVITCLRIRNVDFLPVAPITGKSARRLIYEADIGFDGKAIKSEIARLASLPVGSDFLLGLSVLDHCDWQKTDSHLDVTWKDNSPAFIIKQ